MHIEIRKGSSLNPFNRYYYVLVGNNGEDMNKSENYYSKGNAKRAADKLGGLLSVEVVDVTEKPYKKFGP